MAAISPIFESGGYLRHWTSREVLTVFWNQTGHDFNDSVTKFCKYLPMLSIAASDQHAKQNFDGY